MKILLSAAPFHPYQSYRLKFPRFPILNLTLLAASLRGRHEVRIAAGGPQRGKDDELFRAADFRPDVIGFALPSAVSALCLEETLRRLKVIAPNAKIAAGGPFATFEARFCLGLGCDAVFLGEADKTFPEWIDSGASLDFRNTAPRGMAALDAASRQFIRGEDAIVENLDALPHPAWDLLNFSPAIYAGAKAAALEMSRGCPYQCTFCTVPEFGRKYREKSPGRVLEELSELWTQGFRELLFVDNSFALNPASVAILVEGILSRDWKFEFGAYLRADTIEREPALMQLLSRAGLRYAIVGFESYNDASLATMNKGSARETNLAAARILHEAGVFSIGSHIYGTPGETAGQMLRTYRHGVRACDLYKAGLFTPLPGSSLYTELIKTGQLSDDDPLAMNFVRYHVGGRARRLQIRLLGLLLFLAYNFHPARLLRIFARDPWTRRIFRAEYRTLLLRVLALLRWPRMRGRATPDCIC